MRVLLLATTALCSCASNPTLSGSGPGGSEAEFERLPACHEIYDRAPWRGTLTLDRDAGELRFEGNDSSDRRLEKRIALEGVRGDWIVTTFTQVGNGELLVVGIDRAPRRTVGMRVRLDPDSLEPVSAAVAFETTLSFEPTDVDLLPDGRRVAILDAGAGTLLVAGLEGGVEIVHSSLLLTSMRYVHTHSVGEKGVSVWATRVPEAMIHGPGIGPSVEITDADGDGVFETARG
ncbi:MAG TPA: hypothetical protein ENJ09_15555 [Planctomycetes bacterium]|nr:hypothetical protein [Planctomycetota bacterium]